jgi:uncharacterized lipoprotein NlpE involved in copper resistance
MDSNRHFIKKIFLCILIILVLLGCNNEKESVSPQFPETIANPPGGNYPEKNFPVVTLECNKPATIYYTLNGELPEPGRSYTLSGRNPVEGIAIRSNTTLRFFAIDDEGNQEVVKTEVYTIDPPPVSSAAPRGGTFNKPVRVTLVTDEEATVYYTLDGSTPTTASFVYSGPVLISEEGVTVLKFFAIDLLGNQEDVKTEQYIIDVTPPVTDVIPSGGRYSSASTITLIADEPASIYYKLCVNEYNPDKCSDPAVTDPDVLVGDTTVSGIEVGTGILKYFAVDRAGNSEQVKTEVYLSGNSPYTYAYPSGGIYRTPQIVQLLSDVLPGATATVYYTTDGTDPDFSSPSCLSPCSILIYSEGQTVLKFFAQDSFSNTEPIRTEVYTVDSIPPTTTISPGGGEYVGPQSLTLSSDEPATIYYTLDGSIPTPGAQNTLSGTSPVSGIVVAKDRTVRFMSIDTAGNVESSVKSAVYSILMKFTEEFNDDSKKNSELTDADWNTEDGELKLMRMSIPVLKTITTGGTSYGFDIYNSYIFLADGTRGLKIYDISFPQDPQLKGIYPPLPGESFYSVVVRENIAFVGTTTGVLTLDVSDPSNPLFLSRWGLSGGSAYDLKFFGKYLLVAGGTGGLWIMNGANLQLTDNAVALAIYGTTLYVADTQGDIKVVDISNPQSPALVRTVSLPGSVLSVLTYGNSLFAGTDNGIIYRFALEDPEKPVYVSSLTLPQSPVNTISYSGRYLFAGTQGGVYIIGVSDSIKMALLSSLSRGNVNALRGYGNYMFLSGDNFLTIAVDNYKPPVDSGFIPGFTALEPIISGSRLFIPANDGLRIIDLSDIENPISYPPYSGTGALKGLSVQGNYAFVAQGTSGFKILDVYDPTNIREVSSLTTVDAYDVLVDGARALLADGSGGLKIIDISNSTSPAVVGVCAPPSCLPLGSSAKTVATQGRTAFAGLDTNSICVIDISDEANPAQLNTITTAGIPQDIEIAGNYLYTAEGTGGIEVFYIANPNFPIKAGALAVPNNSATGIAISGNTLFIADGNAVHFVDISHPHSPYIFRTYSKNSYDIVRNGEFLLISDGSGVEIADIATESFAFKTPGTAGSININIQPDRVISGKITVSQITGSYGDIKYYLSNDGGNTWIEVTPGGGLSNFSVLSNDLRWKAVLSTGDVRRTPKIDKLEVYYKYE